MSAQENAAPGRHIYVNERMWPGTHSRPPTTPCGKVALGGKSVSRVRFCESWRITGGRTAHLVNSHDVSTLLPIVR